MFRQLNIRMKRINLDPSFMDTENQFKAGVDLCEFQDS